MGEKESSSELLSVQGFEADQDVLSLVADYEERKHKSGFDQPIGIIQGACNFRCYANSFVMIILLSNS